MARLSVCCCCVHALHSVRPVISRCACIFSRTILSRQVGLTPGKTPGRALARPPPEPAACDAATRSLAGVVPARGSLLSLAACHLLAAPLRRLYVFYSGCNPLPLRRTRGDDGEGTFGTAGGGGGGTAPLPAPLLESLAQAIDRYAEVLRVAAEVGGATERERTQTVAGALVGASRIRFYLDAAANDLDCTREEAQGSDWVCGVLRRIRRAAAVVVTDARATSAGWPCDSTASSAGSAGETARSLEAAGWLVKLARVCQQFAVRLFNASQLCRARAFASLCAELVERAVDVQQKIEAQPPPADASCFSPAGDGKGGAAAGGGGLNTPLKQPAGTPAVAAHAVTHTAVRGGATFGGATVAGGGVNSNDCGMEASLTLLCAARHLEGHCLVHLKTAGGGEAGAKEGEAAAGEILRVAVRAEALDAFASSLRSRCRLDQLCGVGSSAAAAAPQSHVQLGGAATAVKPEQLGASSRPQGTAGVPSLIELVALHAAVRGGWLLDVVEGSVHSDGAAPAAALTIILDAVAASVLPSSYMAAAAIAEISELGAHAPKARSSKACDRLASEACAVAETALRAVDGASHPLDHARVSLALAELHLCSRGGDGDGGDGAAGVRECVRVATATLCAVAPLCASLHLEAVVSTSAVPPAGSASAHGGNGDGGDALNVESMKVAELKDELLRRGISAIGKKDALQQRLRDAIDEEASGSEGSGDAAEVTLGSAPSVSDETIAAVEIYARGRLLLAAASLASLPVPSRPALAEGTDALLDAKACGAASQRAGGEADASLRAWISLLGALRRGGEGVDWAWAESLRRALPDTSRTVSAVLRCAKVLWNALRDSSAQDATDLAAAAAIALSAGGALGDSSASATAATRQSDLAEAFRARMLVEIGQPSAAYEALTAAAERSAPCEPRRVVFFDIGGSGGGGGGKPTRPAMSPTLGAALAAVELSGGSGGDGGAPAAAVGTDAAAVSMPCAAECQLDRLVTELSKQGALLEAAHGHVALARTARWRRKPSVAMRHALEALRLAMRHGASGLSSTVGAAGSGGVGSTGSTAGLGSGGGGASSGHDGDAEATACDAMLILSELWTARGCWVEAKRYLHSALTVSRAVGLPRAHARALMAHAALNSAAARPAEAEISLSMAGAVIGAHMDTGESDSVAGAVLPSASTRVLALRLHTLRSVAAGMSPSSTSATLEHANAALDAFAAAVLPADSAAASAERAAVLLRVGVARRCSGESSAALAALEEAAALLSSTDVAMRLCTRDGGSSMVAEIFLQLGLAHSNAAMAQSSDGTPLLWRPVSMLSSSQCPHLPAARDALTRALHLSAHGAAPATLQCILSALASCCGPSHAAAGSRLLASSIGVGVRHQVQLLQQTEGGGQSSGHGGDLGSSGSDDREGAGYGEEAGGGVDLIGAAMTALSLAAADVSANDGNEPKAAGKAGRGGKPKGRGNSKADSGAEQEPAAEDQDAAWARSLLTCRLWSDDADVASGGDGGATPVDDWMRAPPAGCAVCALAVPPSGRGLLVSRWTADAPPVLIYVPPVAAGEAEAVGDGDAASLLRELTQLLEESRDSSSGAAAAGEGERAALAASSSHFGSGAAAAVSAAIAAAAGPAESAPNAAPSAARRGTKGTGKVSKATSAAAPSPPDFFARLVAELPGFPAITLTRANPTITLGKQQRGAGCIKQPEASGSHCTLSLNPESGGLTLTDTSTNGTCIDGTKIRENLKDRPRDLVDDQTFSIVARSREDSLKRFDGRLPVYRVMIRSTEQEDPEEEPSGSASGAATEAAPEAIVTEKAAVPAETISRERAERAGYWARREALDARLGRLSERIQSSLLGHASCLLVPPAASPAEREALTRLSAWALGHARECKWAVHASLLSAACEALPLLAQSELKDAVAAAVAAEDGAPLAPSALVGFIGKMRATWKREAAALPGAAAAAQGSDEGDGAGAVPPRGKAKGKSALASAAAAAMGDETSPGGGERLPLVLLLDESLGHLPWESVPLLRSLAVSRLPCAAFLGSCERAKLRMQASGGGGGGSAASKASAAAGACSARFGDGYYVLNPAGDLARTQATFGQRFASLPWEGVSGEPPSPTALSSALTRKDLYVYCGHGDGGKYLPAEKLQRLPNCSATLLMGCSSGALVPHGSLAPTGMALAYMHAHCPALVANLWDVTDGESDRFCSALVDHCADNGGSLLDAVAKARSACKLRFLTGAAAVTYGVPLEFHGTAADGKGAGIGAAAAGKRPEKRK